MAGRTKAAGAPLSGGEEFSQPDFALTGRREYLQHTGSALFAVPPGVQPRGYLGQALLA